MIYWTQIKVNKLFKTGMFGNVTIGDDDDDNNKRNR